MSGPEQDSSGVSVFLHPSVTKAPNAAASSERRHVPTTLTELDTSDADMPLPRSRTAWGWRRLYSHLSSRRRWQLLFVGGLMLLGAISELVSLSAVVPFIAVLVAPEGIASKPYVRELLDAAGVPLSALPVAISLAFAFLTIISAGIRTLLLWTSLNFSYGVGHDLSSKLYARTLERPYSFHSETNSSEIVAAVNKVQELAGGYITPGLNGLIALILAISIVLTLLVIHPVVAIGAAAAFGLSYLVIAFIVRGRLSIAGQLVSETHNKRIKALQEGLGAIRDVILDRSQLLFSQRFSAPDAQFAKAQTSSNFLGSAPRVVVESVGMLVLIAFALGFSRTSSGFTGLLPVLAALGVGAQKLLPLIQQIYIGWSALVSRQAVLLDVLRLVDFEPPSHAPGTVRFERTISLRAVSFSFSHSGDAQPTLCNVDLTIRKGERIGIVGRTGSGKSTLLDIVMGLLPPQAGSVQIDGEPLTEANMHGWQEHVAHVPQSIYMIDASIAENIALGVPHQHIDMERVVRAARIAQIDAHIASLPEGYNTDVGERGIRISGGQRQRIGIARALYKQADVLVLDEATSALDDDTEARVMRAIESLPGEPTVIMIAHRLTSLVNCHRIVEVRQGRVVQVSLQDRDARISAEDTFYVAGTGAA